MPRKLATVVREQIRQRANSLCEYCHTDERWQCVRFTVDHLTQCLKAAKILSRIWLLLAFTVTAARATSGPDSTTIRVTLSLYLIRDSTRGRSISFGPATDFESYLSRLSVEPPLTY